MVTRRWFVVTTVALLLGACVGGGDDEPLSASATSTTEVEASTTTSEVAATTTMAATATTAAPRPTTTARPSPGPAAAPPPAAQPTTTAFKPDPPSITIQNFAFNPATLRIARNTTVTATNKDTAPHTWTADGGQWNSGDLVLNMTFSHAFTQPGTFAYHCERHPSMKGTVQVV